MDTELALVATCRPVSVALFQSARLEPRNAIEEGDGGNKFQTAEQDEDACLMGSDHA